ncbi:MAG: hypothetical protein BZ136_09360, partial [Methanosphaera sp. rholeuAM74]
SQNVKNKTIINVIKIMKNYKKIFFVLTLITLLATVGAVCAADDADTTIATDTSVSDAATVTDTTSDQVAAEPVTTTSNDNKVDTKTIKKEEKPLKQDGVTIDGVVYDKVYENQRITAWMITNEENQNTYMKNCNFTENDDEDDFYLHNYGNILYIDNIKTLEYNLDLGNYKEEGTVIINNTDINQRIQITNRGTLYIYNSTLNSPYINNQNKIIIDDLSKKGNLFKIYGNGEIITNNSDFGVYSGNNTIENQIIDSDIINTGNLTIINSTLNSTLKNSGVLNISDDVIFGEKFKVTGDGQIIINDITTILPYITTINGNYTISDITLNDSVIFKGDIILNNCIINCPNNENYGILELHNCIINISNHNYSWLNNYYITIINNDTQIISGNIAGNGTVFYGERPESFNPTEFNGDNTVENMTFNIKSTNNGNLVLIKCNITELITNNGHVTFINCSFSNNNMNKSSISPSTGYLLDNKGTARLENCVIENNTFNYTGSYNGYSQVNGAILNNGTMTVVDTVGRNNSLGYYRLDEDNPGLRYGAVVGRGSVIANIGTLTVESSNFTNNYAGESGGAIYNEGKLSINNALFEDNLANAYGGAISSKYHQTYNPIATYDSQMEITNSIFKNNKVDLPINMPTELTGGGAIHINRANTTINNCTFDNNNATTSVTGLMGVTARGGAIAIMGELNSNSLANINDSSFYNHTSNVIQNGKWGYDYLNGSITNCIFENNKGGINDIGNLNITFCTFKNTIDADAVIYEDIRYYGKCKTISNNQFIDNNVVQDTIYKYISGDYNNQTIITLTISDNTYTNTTIDDTLTLNVPNKIYTGEPITITGTYTINTLENYDADILKQTKFNVYINGELDQTVDTLEFTVTPTAGTMMVTVQPTISQT